MTKRDLIQLLETEGEDDHEVLINSLFTSGENLIITNVYGDGEGTITIEVE